MIVFATILLGVVLGVQTVEVVVAEGVTSVETLLDGERALRRQHVVWLVGRHLPDRVTLTERAVGIELVH